MTLGRIRKKIDRLDCELLNLLNERMALALRTKGLKSTVRDARREREIVSQLKMYAADSSVLSGEFIETLFTQIFEESRRIQTAPKTGAKSGNHS